jgi:hypothetical protein
MELLQLAMWMASLFQVFSGSMGTVQEEQAAAELA